ncbi:hypothetical protein CSC75_05425 [Pseudoxanthomonas wuyuanensis]|nr:hypothetical protein CSC75_05425 [Pseudoxanthomonas wuyuanensis]
MRQFLPAALAVLAVAALAQETEGYAQAKAKADADEASLPAAEKQQLVAAQGRLLEQLASACATPRPDVSSFVVVMELDAEGRVVGTWRQGSTPLAICFQKGVANQTLTPPPRVPFHTSLELTFTP